MTPAGPQRRIAEQRLGTAAAVGAEIERQHDALAERLLDVPPVVDGGEAFAADHQCRPERQPEGAIGHVGEAGVDPHRDAGQRVGNAAHELEMIADAGDGVEIGDIERGRAGDGQQATGDRYGIVGGAERALNRAVIGAVAGFGLNHGAVLEVESRNNSEIAHDRLSTTA